MKEEGRNQSRRKKEEGRNDSEERRKEKEEMRVGGRRKEMREGRRRKGGFMFNFRCVSYLFLVVFIIFKSSSRLYIIYNIHFSCIICFTNSFKTHLGC